MIKYNLRNINFPHTIFKHISSSLYLFIHFFFYINYIMCKKIQNEYIITNITYDNKKPLLIISLEYNKSKTFDIKNYDIDNIKKNSTINLIRNLTFEAGILSPDIFHFSIADSGYKRFNPSLVAERFINEMKKKKFNKKQAGKKYFKNFGFKSTKIGEPFSFTLRNKNTKKKYYKFNGPNFLFTDTLIMFDQLLTSKNIYGFGERNFDFNLEIGKYTTWPNDTTITYRDLGTGGYNLMGHQPIGLHRTKEGKYLGLIFMNINAQDLIINTTNNDNNFEYFLRHITIGGVINYYITLGDTPEHAINLIHKIIGRPIVPPFWALGWHQCRWGYKTTKDLFYVLNNYTHYKIPIDGIWTDLDLMGNKQNFKLSFSHIGTPAFIKYLHKLGKKFVPLLDYGIPIDPIDKYYNIGMRYNDSFFYSNYTKNHLISYIWPGYSVFPDLFTVQGQNIWIEGIYDYYILTSYDGLWIDMNEPAMISLGYENSGEIFPVNHNVTKENFSNLNLYENIPYIPGQRYMHDSLSSKSISVNAYSSRNDNDTNYFTMYNIKCLISKIQTEVTYRFFKFYLHKRPFVLSRGNTIGHGNFGFHWLGDNVSNFKYLKYSISNIFNYNIFGIPMIGADICGFHGNAYDELCARWHILGAFYPFSRNHNVDTSLDQEFWKFNDEYRRYNFNYNKVGYPKEGYTFHAAKKAIKLKYSLLRYTYTQIFLISLGMKAAYFKPCFFEFPNDDFLINNNYVLNTHIMLGDSFLFIPNLNERENDYLGYIPNENFNKFPEGTSVKNYNKNSENGNLMFLNGEYLTINLFLRGGKIIPYQNVTENITCSRDLRYSMVNLVINPDSNKKAEGQLLFDSDKEDVIENMTYLHVNIKFNSNKIFFSTLNFGKKTDDYIDHFVDDVMLYRASEINESIYSNAEIKYIDNQHEIEEKNIIYNKTNDIMTINHLKIPIYLIDTIYLR